MGVRLIVSDEQRMTAMYSSSTDWAFGPVFHESSDHASDERAELFLKWLAVDPRALPDNALETKYSEFLAVEKELWNEKEAEERARYAEDDAVPV